MTDKVIIDVRERDEFDAEHVQNSINVPLTDFNKLAPGIFANIKKKDVLLMCLSGNRAKMAYDLTQNLGLNRDHEIDIYVGGIKEWKRQELATVANKSGHLPILRQVHMAAGLLGLLSVTLGFVLNPNFFVIAGFVGLGMFMAGATGTCLMAKILSFMPWNRARKSVQQEVCTAGTGTNSCAG